MLLLLFSMWGATLDYMRWSEDFLYAVKTDETTQVYVDSLATADLSILLTQMPSDQEKKAFWLNIYNAFVQRQLKHDSSLYASRSQFFSQKSICIGGRWLSLDDVEHGILRHSKNKYSLGYLPRIFPSKFEKKFRVQKLDYRIHFALNCGAKSCPAIAFYTSQNIDQELETALESFLQNSIRYDTLYNKVHVSVLFRWFRADFGGRQGVLSILQQNGIIEKNAKPRIRYLPYDWGIGLDRYAK